MGEAEKFSLMAPSKSLCTDDDDDKSNGAVGKRPFIIQKVKITKKNLQAKTR